jgi:DNA-binding MarR family transcriptional regulator
MAHSRKSDPRRLVWLSEEDVSAAARLLSLLGAPGMDDAGPDGRGASKAAARNRAVERASLALYLRQRRIERLGEMFAHEPPFQMLLSLFVSEKRESAVTITRLSDLAWLTPSTTLRWLEALVGDGWISRTDVADDARKSRLCLTDKAHAAIEELFGWPE